MVQDEKKHGMREMAEADKIKRTQSRDVRIRKQIKISAMAQTQSQTDRQTETHKDRQTGREGQRDRQTDRQTNGQTQTGRQIDILTD